MIEVLDGRVTEVLLVSFEDVPVADVLRLDTLVGVLMENMMEVLLVDTLEVEIDADVVRVGVLVVSGREVLRTLLVVLDILLATPADEEAAQLVGVSLFNCS